MFGRGGEYGTVRAVGAPSNTGSCFGAIPSLVVSRLDPAAEPGLCSKD